MRIQVLIALAFCVAACAQPAEEITKHEVADGLYVVSISGTADPRSFEALASETCAGRAMCMVGFWEKGAEPSSMPFSEEQISAQLFAYTINRESGFQRSAWACEKYKDIPPAHCIPRLKAAPESAASS